MGPISVCVTLGGVDGRGWGVLHRQTVLFRGAEDLLACMEGLLNDPEAFIYERIAMKIYELYICFTSYT